MTAGRAVLVLALFLSCGAALAQQMQVIDLHYRRADDLIPVLQPLLEPGDAITGLDDKLFVRADPATMARVLEALDVIDQPPRQLVITVGQDSTADVSTAGVRGSATISGGDVSVGVNRPPGTGNSAQVVAVDRSRQTSMRNVSSVRALDGTEAYIAVGQQVPLHVDPGHPRVGRPGRHAVDDVPRREYWLLRDRARERRHGHAFDLAAPAVIRPDPRRHDPHGRCRLDHQRPPRRMGRTRRGTGIRVGRGRRVAGLGPAHGSVAVHDLDQGRRGPVTGS